MRKNISPPESDHRNKNNILNNKDHLTLCRILDDLENKVDQIGKEIVALENQLDSYQEKVRDVIYD